MLKKILRTIVIGGLFFQGIFPVEAAAERFLFIPDGGNFYVYGGGTGQFIINQSRLTKWGLDKDLERLSSGRRINSAADDPAGLAVSEKMNSLIQSLRREAMNAEDARNRLDFIDSALARDMEAIKRMRELLVRSMNGIMGKSDRELIQAEIEQMIDEIDTNAGYSEFNRMKVIPQLTSETLGLKRVSAVGDREKSLGAVDEALMRILRLRAVTGSQSNVLGFQIEGKYYYFINLQEAESRIRDQDMGEGITSLMKNGVLLRTKYGLLLRSR